MLVNVPDKALELVIAASGTDWQAAVTTDVIEGDKECYVHLHGPDQATLYATWSNGTWKSGMLRRGNGSVVQMTSAGHVKRTMASGSPHPVRRTLITS